VNNNQKENSNTGMSPALPTPQELASQDEMIKVTISLSKASVDFFKTIAKSHKTPYQKIIRRLIDEYVMRHNNI